MLSMFSVMAALMLFSCVVLVGGVLVRRLRLPTDLPFALQFTCPAPACPDTRGDRTQAQQRAALQRTQQDTLNHAQQLCSYLIASESAACELAPYLADAATDPLARTTIQQICARAKEQRADYQRMETWLTDASFLEHQQQLSQMSTQYATSNSELETLLASLPQPSMRRILLLLAVLVCSVGLLLFIGSL